jgi:hypothetical protein
MTTITIYGASDDLIYVDGDVPGCNEYGAWRNPKYVELSNGAMFKAEYDANGEWRISQVRTGGAAADGTVVTRAAVGTLGNKVEYSEQVTVTGPIEWVDVWLSEEPTIAERMDKIADTLIENGRLRRDLPQDDVDELFRITNRIRRRA